MKRPSPAVSKGAHFPFQVAIACWIDLLGYGRMISGAGFNPLHPDARQALARIQSFHRIVSQHSTRDFPTLVMNDGAVAYRDLSLRTRSVTHDFLTRAWQLFEAISDEERESGNPGARLVLACGFRMRKRRASLGAAEDQLASIVNRLQYGEIDAHQAIHEAAAMRPFFDIVPQLQANFAFTKAYVAEQGGAKRGLPGAKFYVDTIIFGGGHPAWIQLGPDIPWTDASLNLQATFAAVERLPTWRHPPGGPSDVLDGLAIAQALARNPDVLSALRAAGKP